ncbi:MAG: tetratricopeptide repeat protein [Gammaproteobacteria bacterium]|nr:tetratricopeptide repeat protein [Gammaproteobacteria bacterium]
MFRLITSNPTAGALRAGWLLSIALVVSGCAGVSSGRDAGRVALPEPVTTPVSERAETIYKLLVAEVAGHRGALDVAVANYLEVARATGDPEVSERALRIAIFSKDDEGAREAATLWTEQQPDNREAQRVLSALYVRSGDESAAVAALNRMMDGWKGPDAHGYRVVMETLARERDKEAAKAVMARFMESRRDDPEALLAWATFAVRVKDNALAEELLQEFLATEPDHQAANLLLVQVLQEQDKLPRALEIMERMVASRPDDASIRLPYARLLVSAKRYDQALEQFSTLERKAPANADVIFARALLLLQTNRVDEAAGAFERLLELGEKERTAHFYLGQIAVARKDMDVALEHYDAVDRGQHYLDAQLRTAALLADENGLAAALAHLHGINTRNEQQAARVAMVEAELQADKGSLEAAMATYDRGLAEYPDNADLRYARAMLAEKMGRIDLLERDLRAILDADPTHVQALNALGYTLADRTDRYEEAHDYIQRALKQRPDDYYILDSMGWVLYRLGRHDEALEYLRRAASLSDDVEVAAHLGEVLWVAGRKEEARAVWDNALEHTPDDRRLLEVIKRFVP